jgi:hypothetical protein
MSMFEEIANGQGLSFSQAARVVPGRGKSGCHPSCIWRWATDGIRLRDGSRLKLESVRLGGRYVTSRGAIKRFLSACNDAETVNTSEATETKQTRAAKASAKLEAMGA